MNTKMRALSLTLLVLFILGTFLPARVKAEEPTPTPAVPSTPENGETFVNAPPSFLAPHLLNTPIAPYGCTSAYDTFENLTDTPIPDESVITSTIQVSGVGISLWDLDVSTYIQHTYNADLDIYLISPSGTEVTLTTDNGGSNNHVFNGTSWDDQWVGPSVGDYGYADNVPVLNLSPEEAMGAFIGENPNGTWKLVIHDDAESDTGLLDAWSLHFSSLPVTPDVVNAYSIHINTSLLIPDGATVEASIPFSIPDPISHLTFQMEIEHPNSEDLDVFLVSPDGLITVTLTTDNGGTLDNVFNEVSWNDKAGATNPPGAVTDTAFEDGIAETPLVPENALSAFIGATSGNWKLILVDDAGGNTGTLTGWGMYSPVLSCAPDVGVYFGESYLAPIDQPINYFIGTYNFGPTLAHNIMMTETLPANTFFQSFTPAPGWTCDTPNVGENGPITCQTPSLASGALVTHTLQLQPIAIPHPLEDNEVSISTSDDEFNFYNNENSFGMQIAYPSANGNFWDIQDALNYAEIGNDNLPLDDGAISDGGQDAFDSWGTLTLQVMDEANTLLIEQPLTHFGLTFTGDGWNTSTPQTYEGITVSRTLYAPGTADYLRYLETFTNSSTAVRQVVVAWGDEYGLGSDNWTTLAATSSGDLAVGNEDLWALTIQNHNLNPAGPAEDPPLGFVLRGSGDTSFQGAVDMSNDPFTTSWPGNEDEDLGYKYAFTLQPGETKHLMYFVYQGLAEEKKGPSGCTSNCVIPPAGSEIALAQTVLAALAANPDVCGLSATVRENLVNWPDLDVVCSLPIYLPITVR